MDVKTFKETIYMLPEYYVENHIGSAGFFSSNRWSSPCYSQAI